MYFEDEKENMNGAFDDLEVDIDGDDKSVTWDDLLNDDADIDLSDVKKDDFAGDAILDVSDDEDMALLEDSEEMPAVAPRRTAPRPAAPRKDAFDVFGGADDDTNDSYAPEPARSYQGDTITPDLTNRTSARSKARMRGDDDDIYFEPRNARKSSSSILPTIVGVLVACIFILGLGYLFMTYNKTGSIANLDARSLFNVNKNTQETPLIEDNTNKPVIDINAPAEQNMANAGASDEKDSKK